MPWTHPDFERILDELQPQIGNHAWAVSLMRWSESNNRAKKLVNSIVKRANTKNKPLFIFESSGIKLLGDMRDRYARALASRPTFEDFTARTILEQLKARSGTYIDVGTNMGALCAQIAKNIDKPVIAIEPDLDTAKRAAATFALNGLKNVVLYHAAVGDSDGEITFFSAPGHSEAASLSKEAVGENAVSTTVPLVTIDTVATESGGGPIAFIKIDVEGHEPQAINGAEQTIRKHQPNLMFEHHWDIAPKLGWTAEGLCEQIGQWGDYEFSAVGEEEKELPFPPTREMGLVLNILAKKR